MPAKKSITSRRGFLGALAISGATLAASRAACGARQARPVKGEKGNRRRLPLSMDFGDPQRFGQLITNMNNHLSVYEYDTMRVKLVIVAHGAGLKFFLDDLSGTPWANDKIDPDLYKRFTGLTKFGVEAYLCEITYKRQNIDMAKTQDGFVPEIRAVGRRHRGRTSDQGLRLSQGWLRPATSADVLLNP